MRKGSVLAGVLSICLAPGCADLPGEVVGTYRIRMTLEENECGKYAVHLLDGKLYSAELRSEGPHAYWRVPGQTPLNGKYDAPDFHFEYQSLVARSPDDAGVCRLLQSEVLNVRVKRDGDDAGTEEESDEEGADEDNIAEPQVDAGSALEGEHELTVSAEPGGDCKAALMPEGAFEKLPCAVRYSLRGEPTKPFK